MNEHLRVGVQKCFEAHEAGVPFIFEGFRGCYKTLTFSAKLTAWLVGMFPEKTNIIIGATDDNPDTIAKHVANYIEWHPDWKRVFPHVVPDKTGEGKGWSVGGYWVIDNRMSREEWAKQQTSTIDPTFVGGGCMSAKINGRHPNGALVVDDLHDAKTSTSELERARIKEMYFQQISKTTVRKNDKLLTWVNFACVPFARDDTYQTIIDTGNCVFYKLPCMTRAADNAPGAVYIDGINKDNGAEYKDIKGWWFLTAPEIFGVDSVIKERALGQRQFWQMQMMDIEAAKAARINYHLYDHNLVDKRWPHGGGCDFATLGATKATEDKGRDKFSVSIGARTPYNTLVVDGGFIGQVTQARAEDILQSAQDTHVSWRGTKLEVTGSGEQFFLMLAQRNPNLLLSQGRAGHKSKDDRIMLELGPWLENGQVLISDEQTPYLQELRQSLDDFPEGNKDIRDGLYYLALNFPECLVKSRPSEKGISLNSRKKRGLFSPWAKTEA
jgi:hypothetical protein